MQIVTRPGGMKAQTVHGSRPSPRYFRDMAPLLRCTRAFWPLSYFIELIGAFPTTLKTPIGPRNKETPIGTKSSQSRLGVSGVSSAGSSEINPALRPHKFHSPEGPSTQYLRTLVPKTIPFMAFGTRVLKCWVLAPSGQYRTERRAP